MTLILAALLVGTCVMLARGAERIEGRVRSALYRHRQQKAEVVQEARKHWEHSTFFQQAINEIEAELGLGAPGALSEGAFETADQLTRRIRVGMAKLQVESRMCCRRHLNTAQLRNFTGMYQLKDDVRCLVSRNRMAARLEVMAQYLGMYPFGDDQIEEQAIVVQELKRYCIPCSYLTNPVAGAPPHCLTAIVLNPDLNPTRSCGANGENKQS